MPPSLLTTKLGYSTSPILPLLTICCISCNFIVQQDIIGKRVAIDMIMGGSKCSLDKGIIYSCLSQAKLFTCEEEEGLKLRARAEVDLVYMRLTAAFKLPGPHDRWRANEGISDQCLNRQKS